MKSEYMQTIWYSSYMYACVDVVAQLDGNNDLSPKTYELLKNHFLFMCILYMEAFWTQKHHDGV